MASIVGAGTSAAQMPQCFGAAERDPLDPCSNPTVSVVPSLHDAAREPFSPCLPIDADQHPAVCTFGASAATAVGSVALLGDSHALQWRAAVDVVAQAERWQGFSITLPGCLFSAAVRTHTEPLYSNCRRWNRSVPAWFAAHPQVSTVFVSQTTLTPIVVPAKKKKFDVQVAGFRRAWKALPATVKHVVVIRDAPLTTRRTFECVRRAIAAGKDRPGRACPLRRSGAMRRDAAVKAVMRLHAQRYGFVDLTEFFCSRRYCYPVIGGVLVHRDVDHITAIYATTLGPYLLRKVRRLMASW